MMDQKLGKFGTFYYGSPLVPWLSESLFKKQALENTLMRHFINRALEIF